MKLRPCEMKLKKDAKDTKKEAKQDLLSPLCLTLAASLVLLWAT